MSDHEWLVKGCLIRIAILILVGVAVVGFLTLFLGH
jgi:hypothetical protein